MFPKPIDQVTPKEIDGWLQTRGAPKTRANHRISAISLMNFAKRKGYLLEDRLSAAERTERIKVAPTDDPDIFHPSELRKLLAAASPELRPFLAIGAFAGARTAEICRLTWACWNPRQKALSFPARVTKTARRRVITVEDNLAEWLNLYQGKREDLIVPYFNIHKFLRPLTEEAGVKWKQNGLRKSAVSYHLELHQNPPLTSKMAGHSIQKLESHYLHLTDRATARRWFSIRPNNRTPTTET
jgi:integrase